MKNRGGLIIMINQRIIKRYQKWDGYKGKYYYPDTFEEFVEKVTKEAMYIKNIKSIQYVNEGLVVIIYESCE